MKNESKPKAEWSDEDWQKAAVYGNCVFCGGPRDATREDREGGVYMVMRCRHCGEEAE